MAAVAVNFLMLAGQRPVSISRVVESRRFPLLVAMALPTLLTEPAAMGVLRQVTAEALSRDPVFQVAAAMTILTVDACMDTLQTKTSLLAMIELGVLPTDCGMTGAALRAAFSMVHVVRRVAGAALLGSAAVPVAEMARHARNVAV